VSKRKNVVETTEEIENAEDLVTAKQCGYG